MIEFIERFPISDLSPADYNPRLIDEISFQLLRESLAKFGVIKPVLINGNGTLIAGHQRVKALLANKETHVPALRTKQVVLKDEARLNLYHNSVETNSSDVCISGELQVGQYQWIAPQRIDVVRRDKPAIVAEIARLIIKYDEWGSLIVSESGKVLFNSDYALATSLIRKPVLYPKVNGLRKKGKNKSLVKVWDLSCPKMSEKCCAKSNAKTTNEIMSKQPFC